MYNSVECKLSVASINNQMNILLFFSVIPRQKNLNIDIENIPSYTNWRTSAFRAKQISSMFMMVREPEAILGAL